MKVHVDTNTSAGKPQRTVWQTPTLVRVGSFGEILAGGSNNGEGGANMMIANL